MEIRVARIFNTYGPRMAKNDGRVISNFIVKALCGEDIEIYGDGSQTRSFCYATDLIDGLWRLMNKDGFTGPVNLGNPAEFTIKETAEKIVSMTGSSSKIVFKPLPVDDPRQKTGHIACEKELGWAPSVPVEEGFKKTIDYFKEKLKGK